MHNRTHDPSQPHGRRWPPRGPARLIAVALALGAAGLLTAAAALPARQAAVVATGQVVIFQHELTPLVAFDDPAACNNAPALAHTLVNLTDETIILFTDDRCGVPLFIVKSGHGSHVSPGQSFSSSL